MSDPISLILKIKAFVDLKPESLLTLCFAIDPVTRIYTEFNIVKVNHDSKVV